jgi:hypothetical protein
MFIAILLTMLIGILWLPSWMALHVVRRLPARRVLRKAWPVWLVQVYLATALIFLADAINLTNPAGYMLAICCSLGVLGALILWIHTSPKRV